MSEYRVALDVYNGPLDLLLYLIRREEIDIYDIPIARITQQYIEYAELLRQVDPEVAGEFLVLAATLMEIKSRMLVPRPAGDETQEDLLDPRLELVRQLLEYKKYKDAARQLEDAADEQAQRHARSPVLAPEPTDEMELEDVDIWDLFEAFNRLLEQTGQRQAVHHVDVDDTPIALHAEDILDSVERAGGAQNFEEVFAGRTRAEMIGLFLALLELIRQRRVRVVQDRNFGTIRLHLLDPTPLDAAELDRAVQEPRSDAPPEVLAEGPFVEEPFVDEPVTADLDGDDDADIATPVGVLATGESAVLDLSSEVPAGNAIHQEVSNDAH